MTGRKQRRLGEWLVEGGLITQEQLTNALSAQTASGEMLGRTLVRLGYLDEDDLVRALCEEAGVPYLSLSEIEPDPAALASIPADTARQVHALPLRHEQGRLLVAMANPFDIAGVTALERVVGRPIQVVGGPREGIGSLVAQLYGPPGATPFGVASVVAEVYNRAGLSAVGAGVESGERRDSATRSRVEVLDRSQTASVLADDIIRRAVLAGATDVHIEPLEDGIRVRYRVDGLLQESAEQPKEVQGALMSRIKILAGLDIAETRLPQDGRVRVRIDGRDVDLRVSTFPTLHGEDTVLRVLDRGRVALELARLGIEREDLELLRTVIKRPHGMIPVTGPTGSGKTSTLYSALLELNTHERCIITLEDPVEYEIAHLRQSQINVRAGLTFANGLRSILRHDPDVILVGEMRDQETVQIAMSAALTGHLVLTTLHTTTAAGAIPRLLDMGVEPFVLASAVTLIISQRLVRTLCPDCKTPGEVPAGVRQRYSLGDGPLYGPRGCANCRYSGFRGRLGIFEMLPISEALVTAIYERRSADEIHREAGRPTLLDDGLRKVRAGLTTLDELFRVTAA